MSRDPQQTCSAVAASLRQAPVVGVVRTPSPEEARRQARLFMQGGLELVEITFSVPGATDLVRELRAERGEQGPPWIGMGTVTDTDRAQAAVAAAAEFIVSPNTHAGVAEVVREAGVLLILGALTCSEIVHARDLGAHIVKVYPLPPVGGAAYLSIVRQPLDDIPMLAAGGFGVEAIPEYRAAGASAFGIGSPLLGPDDNTSLENIGRALQLARGEGT
jgi:2-dehydro-3-deoxyphosphogluconate aldolase/(4S)-4-hydroxy-2-oxoglutarate aldolase